MEIGRVDIRIDNLSYPLNNIYPRKTPDIDNDRFSNYLGIILEL